jgi:hypothetical protein
VTRAATALALLLAACSRGSAPAAQEPAAAPSPEPAAAAPAPPEPEGPIQLPVTSAVAAAGGEVQPLARAGATTVDPAATFTIEVPVALVDARLSLLDGAGAMVPASGGAEIGADGSRFTLVADVPLVAGAEYALRLDGAVAQAARDRDGRAYAPASWTVRVADAPR